MQTKAITGQLPVAALAALLLLLTAGTLYAYETEAEESRDV